VKIVLFFEVKQAFYVVLFKGAGDKKMVGSTKEINNYKKPRKDE
jgi:hypothetical protein